jgi:Major Facilitator Superfamily
MRITARLGPLQERQFRLFFIGQSTSLLGDGMVGVALAFAVLDLTGSVADLGYVLAARVVPMVGFLLVGGVFADRLSRRAVMIGADVTRLLTQGLIAILLLTGTAQVWHLIVLVAVGGAATAFFNPALTGLTPTLVSDDHLQQANVLRGIAQGAGGIAGPVLSGALVATLGAGWALAADAATFGVSAFFLAQLKLPPHERLPARPFVHELLEGWNEVRARTWLWMGLLVAGVANMAAAPFFVLGPAIAKDSLGGPGAWALIVAAFSVGSFAGGLVAFRFRPRRPFLAAFLLYIPFGVPNALMALQPPTLVIAAGVCLSGAGLMLGNAIWETTLQQKIPRHALSRVTAYDWFASLALAPVGNAIVGPIALAVGMEPTLWAGFVLITALNLVAISIPSIRGLRAGSSIQVEPT